MPLSMRADTLEYATATITADHDITGNTIDVSLPTSGNAPATWVTADVVGVEVISGKWKATYRVLIGPAGDFTLTPGVYDWTVRLTDTPEIPVRKVDQLTITAL